MTPDTAVRRRLYGAALGRVPREGWSDLALTRARRRLGLPPGTEKLLFPRGGRDLLRLWADEQIRAAAADLAASPTKGTTARVSEGVRNLVERADADPRLSERAATRLLMPDAAPLAAKILMNASDAVWRAVPDKSLDYNWYSKRIILAEVLTRVAVYHYHHRDAARTDEFLGECLARAVRRGASSGRVVKSLLDIPERLFVTLLRGAR
ncbi:MAG: COQ9 family protein [Alphaproteobacteria bacterium]|nr:COQ9 family protein [Alphaproteobacteria bacterium]